MAQCSAPNCSATDEHGLWDCLKGGAKSLLCQFEPFEETDNDIIVDVDDFLQNSRKFPLQFPVHSPRLENLLQINPFKNELRRQGKFMNREAVSRYINSVYPLVHPRLLPLLSVFLHQKTECGSDVERGLYEGLSAFELVDRLLSNRPAAFINSWDHYLLLDGTPGFGGFENMANDKNPKNELCLEKFNSYDEMKLAALICISSFSPFINDGSRNNCGVVGDGMHHELSGIVIAQVGARFEKEGYMDWQDCIVKRTQNTIQNGYGKNNQRQESKYLQAWANLWGQDYFPTYDEVKENPDGFDYIHIKDAYFNRAVYKARIRMLAEIMIVDASDRLKSMPGKKAYLHVSGVGLSVWSITPVQNLLYVEAWADAIKGIPNSVTKSIACVNFSDISVSSVYGLKSGDNFPDTEIVLRFSKRELFDKVPKGCILVSNYSWDSNSLPGNEFWMGSLSTSAGPAAACSSAIAELHNPVINPRVSAKCLMVASKSKGVLSVKDYLAATKPDANAL